MEGCRTLGVGVAGVRGVRGVWPVRWPVRDTSLINLINSVNLHIA